MEMLKGDKQKFSRGREQNIAFEKLQQRFTTGPILARFYPEPETVTSAKKGFMSGRGNLRPDGLRPPYASRAP